MCEKSEHEREWIQNALNGDEQAFYELINHYHTTVERFARQIGVRDEDIQDVTQEVFIKVYRFLHKYSRGKFSTWLYSVTLNVAKDFFRKQKRENAKVLKTIQENPVTKYEENLDLTEDSRILHDAIKKMDEKYRIPIVLFYFHDASIKEISTIMGMREATVKTRLKRGKERLKVSIAEGGIPYESKAF
ncbi:RNA polymerase sigma factor [Evansella sp. AB-P1]|uniref:RNA polymerase sigma factor n=1 Tax=Evansella sp. AB-P1 TaxID=3037653 RepID=UPI00241C7D9D|nr:RNA polymerase sigma factor [Evansella sp. AB-P1]MDG5786352.1 RNA polymerase sigma factor [Evansella sp. AB-P1]